MITTILTGSMAIAEELHGKHTQIKFYSISFSLYFLFSLSISLCFFTFFLCNSFVYLQWILLYFAFFFLTKLILLIKTKATQLMPK